MWSYRNILFSKYISIKVYFDIDIYSLLTVIAVEAATNKKITIGYIGNLQVRLKILVIKCIAFLINRLMLAFDIKCLIDGLW